MPLGLLVILFFVLLFIGTPLMAVLGGISILPSLINPHFPFSIETAMRSLTSGLDSFLLLAIPLFMFSGVVMARGGISEKLFNMFAYFFGNITAGFPIAVIVTCLFYGAISGSGPATTAAVGSMTIPYLVKRGYSRTFSTSLVAVAGGLGVVIPPSIPMIAYCTIASASVGDLFKAGILPGILIAVCMSIYSYFYCKVKGEDKAALQAHFKQMRQRGFWVVFKESFWALLAPLIILGSIYGGIATPTEAASISVYYALVVSIFFYKTLKFSDLWEVMRETVRTYAPVLFVIASAVVLSRVITLLRIADMVKNAVLSNFTSLILILLTINLILLIAGMFMDAIPALMIFAPIILPITQSLGMSPLHVGIIMVVNLAIGFVTPPVGVNLYVASNMTGIPVLSVSKAALPFIVAFIVALLLITFIPSVSLMLI